MAHEPKIDYEQYNLTGVVAKSLYAGFMYNFLVPGILLFVCYYLDVNYKHTDPVVSGEMINTVFMIIAIVSALLAGFILVMKQKLFSTKLVQDHSMLGVELAEELAKRMRPLFIMNMLIAILGALHFYLTAQFKPALFFMLITFIIFQFVRPRYGFVKKLIDSQLKMLGPKKSA